jgi:hypothetical protein
MTILENTSKNASVVCKTLTTKIGPSFDLICFENSLALIAVFGSCDLFHPSSMKHTGVPYRPNGVGFGKH